MDFFKSLDSKTLKVAFIIVGAIVLLLVSFKAGEFIAYKKAHFSYKWAENYDRNFGGPRFSDQRPGGPKEGALREGFLGGLKDPSNKFQNPHGIFGDIIKIDGNTLVIKDKDNIEKTVLISDKTILKIGKEDIKLSDLKVDNKITIIGVPNDKGGIDAKFIRIFP